MCGWLILLAWRGPTDLERQRVRCVFSECLNDNALEVDAGSPPGGLPGLSAGGNLRRAVVRFFESGFENLVADVVATVFPGDCRACGGPLVNAGIVPICDVCRSNLQPQSMTLCDRCGEALDMEGLRFVGAQRPAEGLLCSTCRMAAPEFARAVAYGLYEDELREMVHLLKYERMSSVAGALGGRLAVAIRMLEGSAKRDLVVVAVPLFPAKERQRGYNQSVLLADAAIASLKKSDCELRLAADYGALLRTRDTESQFNLSPKGRRRNLQGAFAVPDSAAILGREVLLIDDIYTSGATARECARVLRRAGATKVWVATLARAQREMVAMWSETRC